MVKGLTDVGGRILGDKVTLEQLSRVVNKTYTALTKKYNVAFTMVLGVGANQNDVGRFATVTDPADDAAYEQYGRTFSALVSYDAVELGSGFAAALTPVAGGYRLSELIRGPIVPGVGGVTAPAPIDILGGAGAERYALYTEGGNVGVNRGLMMVFNQLLSGYLARFYDAPSAKIYLNLINSFANGSFSQAVMEKGYAHPDIGGAALAYGRRADPTGRSVLLLSIGLILQRLVKDMTPQGVSLHLISTLADVPLYIKESYRANLPVFIKEFGLLTMLGEMLKQFLQRTSVQVGRPDLATVVGGNGVIRTGGVNIAADGTGANGSPASYFRPNVTFAATLGNQAANVSDIVKQRLVDIIDGVAAGAYSMSNAATEVLRELADDPLYLQTEENSIQNYKSRYGRLPLMPLSLVLSYLGDVNNNAGVAIVNAENTGAVSVNDNRLTPTQEVGDVDFKLLYGVRKLISQARSKVTLAEMPGEKAMLDSYNGIVTEREKIDSKRFEDFVGRVVGGLRFLIDTRSYRAGLVASERTFAGVSLVGGAASQGIVKDGADANAVYALRVGKVETIAVVESSYQEEQINNISKTVSTAPGVAALGGNRDMERILNIIDMNIIPINVHALMRAVALVNTYNYVYTFEQMACIIYEQQPERIRDLDVGGGGGPGGPPPGNTRDFFLKLLIDPYARLAADLYGSDTQARGTAGFAHRIFRGDNALGMGRPKFLSDQLFNKALFGSLYPTQFDYDEGGSGTAAAVARGRQDWGQSATVPINPEMTALARDMGLMSAPALVDDILIHAAPTLAANNQAANPGGAANETEVQLGARFQVVGNAMATVRAAIRALLGGSLAGGAQPGTDVRDAITRLVGQITALLTRIGRANQGGSIAGRVAGATVLNAEATAQLFAADVTVALNAPGGGLANVGAAAQFVAVYAARSVRVMLAQASELGKQIQTLAATYLMRAAPQGQTWLGSNSSQRTGVPGQFGPGNPLADTQGNVLTYVGAPDDNNADPWSLVKQVGVGAAKADLQALGKDRFDTRLVRYLFFISNVHRLLRLKLNRELTQYRTVLVSSHSMVNPSVTEYGQDVFGPGETYGNKTYSSDSRLM